MGMVTVTFDPTDVVYLSEIASRVGVQHATCRLWIKRRVKRGDKNVPPPLFTLVLPDNKEMMLWRRDDLDAIVKAYETSRDLRDRSM